MTDDSKTHPLNLAREIYRFRKEKHPLGSNYSVRVRLGHAEIQDLTAIADILSALKDLGYEIHPSPNPPIGNKSEEASSGLRIIKDQD